jgi:hypothetical protein
MRCDSSDAADAAVGKVILLDEIDLFEAVGVRVSPGVPRGLTAKERGPSTG